VISSPDQALEVMDFEARPRRQGAASRAFSAIWQLAWTTTQTLRANREAYSRIQISALAGWWTSKRSTCP